MPSGRNEETYNRTHVEGIAVSIAQSVTMAFNVFKLEPLTHFCK